MNPDQLSLFGPAASSPAGLRYRAGLLSMDEERDLVERFRDLPFAPFEFRGYRGRRRVVSFGWRYDFSEAELRRAEDIPAFLLPLREQAAAFAGLAPSELPHVLLTEYAPGAAIGWHRDKAVFGAVVGVSLLSPCLFRLRRRTGAGWERASLALEPRSAYVLQGSVRTEWEHSIPAVDAPRFSVTLRTLERR